MVAKQPTSYTRTSACSLGANVIESVQVVNALRTSVLARQVLAILESNPRTEATALKTRDVLLNEFSPYNAFVQSLTDDELLMAVSVLAVHHPTGTTAGS